MIPLAQEMVKLGRCRCRGRVHLSPLHPSLVWAEKGMGHLGDAVGLGGASCTEADMWVDMGGQKGGTRMGGCIPPLCSDRMCLPKVDTRGWGCAMC